MEKKLVNDKLNRISKATGIPKGYLGLVLEESDTSLRKWSYNPANVSEKTSKRIFEKIKRLDLLRVRIKNTGERTKKEWYKPSGPSNAREYVWTIHIGPNVFTGDFVPIIRNELFYTQHHKGVESYPMRRQQSIELNGTLCKIAHDKSIELPVGATVWDESLNDVGYFK